MATQATAATAASVPRNREPCIVSDVMSTPPVAMSSRGRRIPLRELSLVPVGIRRGRGAGGVQPGDLRRREIPADGAEVLAQLLLVARADDDAGDGRPLEQPVEG